MPLPVRRSSEGVRIALRVTPKSSATRIEGLGEDAEGKPYLRIRIGEAPEKGKANDAVIRLLSKSWKLSRSDFEIVSGETDRNKIIAVKGNPDTLMTLIGAWLSDQFGA